VKSRLKEGMAGFSTTKRAVSSALNGWIAEKNIQSKHSEALHFAKWTTSWSRQCLSTWRPQVSAFRSIRDSVFLVAILFNSILLSSLLGKLLLYNTFYCHHF